ncbi:hypothetical protein [Phyllobacterium sp. K27]
MPRPLQPDDELFPFDVQCIDKIGHLVQKKDWSIQKEAAFRLRVIESLMETSKLNTPMGLVTLIRYWGPYITENGSADQRERIKEILLDFEALGVPSQSGT